MRVPLPCESMACLPFIRLLLPVDLSGLATHSATHFFNSLCHE